MTRRSTTLASLLLAATLAACGANPSKPEATEVAGGKRIERVKLSPEVIDIAQEEGKVELLKDDRVKCEKYKPLGSNRTQYRCTTVAEKKASEEENAAAMRRLQTPPPSANSSIGR